MEHDREILDAIGHAIVKCLRQDGRVDGSDLGCDSGGWYKMTSIMEAINTSDAQWACSVRNAILQLGPHVSEGPQEIIVFQSLFPQKVKDEVRFQGAFEQRDYKP